MYSIFFVSLHAFLKKRAKNKGKTILSQIISLPPEHEFKACGDRYKGNYRVRNFSCRDQFYEMNKGYFDFDRLLHRVHEKLAFFVTRAKDSIFLKLPVQVMLIRLAALLLMRRSCLLGFVLWSDIQKKSEWLHTRILLQEMSIYFSRTILNMKHWLLKKRMHFSQSLLTILKNIGLFLTDKATIND